MIERELQRADPGYNGKEHPVLPPLPTRSLLTAALETEMKEIESGVRTKGIDVSRFQPTSDNCSLEQLYCLLSYSKSRHENLALLSEYGKNQWLIGNDQLEQLLKQLEQNLENINRAIENINSERKTKQVDMETTYKYLDSRWRDGIKNLVDVNVACIKLEQEINNQKRVG